MTFYLYHCFSVAYAFHDCIVIQPTGCNTIKHSFI